MPRYVISEYGAISICDWKLLELFVTQGFAFLALPPM